jgi:hypothetical protein
VIIRKVGVPSSSLVERLRRVMKCSVIIYLRKIRNFKALFVQSKIETEG